MAILVSGYPHCVEGKIVNLTDIPDGTGKSIAAEIPEQLKKMKLLDKQFGAMIFDTTASNTGVHRGASVRLESFLKTSLLYLGCRHDILELLLGAAWMYEFGPTTSKYKPEMKEFHDKLWKTVNISGPIRYLNIDFSNKILSEMWDKTVDELKTILTNPTTKGTTIVRVQNWL